MIKICFLAPSEYGKNTAVEILKTKYNLINIKIAEPLYHLQNYFYKYIGCNLSGEQDGELLQYLGNKVRKENPLFLLNNFQNELIKYKNYNGIISNDDCRPPDYHFLKEQNFIFIKINGFKRNRIDHTKSNPKSNLEWQNQISFDYEVNNFGDMNTYKKNLFILMNQILIDKGDKNGRKKNVCKNNNR